MGIKVQKSKGKRQKLGTKTEINLFNSLSRRKEEFESVRPGLALVYTCGPTVYDYAHIGNLRSFIFADILVRTLRYNGYEAVWTMNITDIDDKTIAASRKKYPHLPPKAALRRFTREYERYFWQDLRKLNVAKPDHTPRATETIKEMQEMILSIMQKGFAYEEGGSIYFDLKRYSEKYRYGALADVDLSKIKAGARVDADEYSKRNINDFVLWKAKKAGEPFWNFQIKGRNFPGRPGWHIECSAMSKKFLGIPFDIHTGGTDLKFPHHEDELAQTSAACGCSLPVKYWLHNEHLLVEGSKMSKSLGNFFTIRDLEKKGHNPLAFRLLCLQSHYRSKMNFTWSGLQGAEKGLENLQTAVRRLSQEGKPSKKISAAGRRYKQEFLKKINDDLNTPAALALVQKLAKTNLPPAEKLALLLEFDEVFGFSFSSFAKPLKIPKEIRRLAEKRLNLRKEGKWEEADRLRERIRRLGYEIEDKADGYLLRKSN